MTSTERINSSQPDTRETNLPARVSVSTIVRQWLELVDPADQWFLGLVQRDEVWSDDQRAALLDSLLKGYPIGAILLGRDANSASGWVYRRTPQGERIEVEVAPPPWQILDGQQRISSLAAAFSPSPHGHMELDMTSEEPLAVWVPSDEPLRARFGPRSQRVDLSGWQELMSRHPDAGALRELSAPELQDLLATELDTEFTTTLQGPLGEIAVQRWRDLIDVWCEERIPVLSAPVRSPEQLLEVFQRVNRAGTPVDQADIYYAAVKTFWPQAETSLQRIVTRTSALATRFSVLEFATRFARVALGAADPVSVDIAVLSGPQGHVLRNALTDICDEDSVVVRRVAAVCSWLVSRSKLGYGLHSVHRRTLAPVLAWAASSPAGEDERHFEANAHLIDGFLAGTTLFGYRGAFRRDLFDRTSFREAMAAGVAAEPFPGPRIAEVLQHEADDPEIERLGGLDNDADRLRVGDTHVSLVLGIVQSWRFDAGPLHVDHIYANEAAKQDMRVMGLYGRKVTHPLRSQTVNSLGNFWLIPESANTSLGMDRPRVKFEKLMGWLQGGGHSVPARRNWALGDDEPRRWQEIEAALRPYTNDGAIEAAMLNFRGLVEQRAHRLVSDALALVPGTSGYSRDTGRMEVEPRLVDAKVAESAGLSELRADFEAAGAPLPNGSPAPLLASPWTGPWLGREDEVFRIWEHVSRQLKKKRLPPSRPQAEAHGLGFSYVRWIQLVEWVYFGSLLDFGPTSDFPLTLVLSPGANAHGRARYERVRSALAGSRFAEFVPLSPKARIEIPVPMDPALRERASAEAALAFIREVDSVLARSEHN